MPRLDQLLATFDLHLEAVVLACDRARSIGEIGRRHVVPGVSWRDARPS